MIALTLAELAAMTGGELRAGYDTPPGSAAGPGTAAAVVTGPVVTGPVVIDSRKASPGSVFAAVVGERADGHDFAAAAVAAGAVAVLASRPVPDGVPAVMVADVTAALARLARAVLDRLGGSAEVNAAGINAGGVTVAGITGSSGKTSTKDLTAQLAERLGPTVAPEGSFNNEFGVPLTVLRADERTRFLILEMAARGTGHIAALCDIAPPRIGAVLNVGQAHAGEFGSLETVAKAKGELVEALPAGRGVGGGADSGAGTAGGAGGVAILNADDPRVLAMADRTGARVVTFSVGRAPRLADVAVRAADIRLDDLGRASFRLVMPGGMAPVALRLHGAHHVPNALAAAAIAAELGMDVPAIADALSAAVARSKWRMEVRERPDGVLVVNDAYNANPDSMRAAIEALGHLIRELDGQPRRRGVAVLGHMAELGDIADASHADAGRLAARCGAAIVMAVGEQALPVLDGARAVPGWHGEAIAVPDTAAAAGALRSLLRPGDVVLVKASRSAGLTDVAAGLLSEVDR